MWKYIFFGLIIWLGIYIFKQKQAPSNTPKANDNLNTADKVEDMVQCTTCAVHLPRSEAFLVGSTFYCSKAHIQSK